jgi:hypothetical protein
LWKLICKGHLQESKGGGLKQRIREGRKMTSSQGPWGRPVIWGTHTSHFGLKEGLVTAEHSRINARMAFHFGIKNNNDSKYLEPLQPSMHVSLRGSLHHWPRVVTKAVHTLWLEEKSQPIQCHFILGFKDEEWPRPQMDENMTCNPTYHEMNKDSWSPRFCSKTTSKDCLAEF